MNLYELEIAQLNSAINKVIEKQDILEEMLEKYRVLELKYTRLLNKMKEEVQ